MSQPPLKSPLTEAVPDKGAALSSSALLDAIARLAYTVLNQTNFSDMTPEQRALGQALCDYGICQWSEGGYLTASESERNKTRLVVVCKVAGYTNVHF
jgi:hypothetical protein